MRFQSPLFFVFFVCLLFLYLMFDLFVPAKKWYLIGFGSLVWFALIERQAFSELVVFTFLTWLCALQVQKIKGPSQRLWLSLGVGGNLIHLFMFKAQGLGTRVGVAFYSLQLIGFLIDQFEDQEECQTNLGIFLAANSAFYNLSSGPIFQIDQHMKQLRKPSSVTRSIGALLIFRIFWGLAKKTTGDILGDQVDFYYSTTEHSLISSWSLVFAITGQYYLDFSGYSDVAIGIAGLLGIQLPENFALPFLAKSMGEHWQRWHISMTQWVRSYIFLPLSLALARAGWSVNLRAGVSILVCLLFVAAWHGPSVNNFVWGVYNAFFILVGFGLSRKVGHIHFPGRTLLCVVLTFLLGAIGRVLNRTETWETAVQTFRALTHFSHAQMVDLNSGQVTELILILLSIFGIQGVDWYFLYRLRMRPHVILLLLGATLSLTFTIAFGMRGKAFLYGL